MSTGVKIILTLATVIVAVVFCFIDEKANNAHSNWFWRWGKNDPIRNRLCRSDGALRKHTKKNFVVFAVVWMLSIWLLVPNA